MLDLYWHGGVEQDAELGHLADRGGGRGRDVAAAGHHHRGVAEVFALRLLQDDGALGQAATFADQAVDDRAAAVSGFRGAFGVPVSTTSRLSVPAGPPALTRQLERGNCTF